MNKSLCWQVIYVRPGYEANLDSLVQDTIRLTTYAKVRLCLNYYQVSWNPQGQNLRSIMPISWLYKSWL